MFSERLQILISPEQRRALEAEAERREASVASVIREAIDLRLGTVDRAARLRAVEELSAMNAGPFLTPEELNRIVAEEREAQFDLPPAP
jgi:predicted transcriptional regulator